MDSVIRLFNSKKNIQEPTEQEKILNNIREVSKLLNDAYERFEYESDSDLVEATVYELEALKARYRYLLKIAKSKGIKCDYINSINVVALKEKGIDDLG
ncbi:MAG: YaaL family protein [Clostridiales bacterium]|nr:YaaL family protein [Clostridiales bacterium]